MGCFHGLPTEYFGRRKEKKEDMFVEIALGIVQVNFCFSLFRYVFAFLFAL